MPSDPTLWVVFLALSAIVLALALWLGRGLSVRRSKDEFSLEVKERSRDVQPAVNRSTVSVARGLDAEGLAAGNVTGADAPVTGDVDVLSGAKLKNARLGDITGVRQDGGPAKDRP